MRLGTLFAGFQEDLIDWTIACINGKPEDIHKWQKQGVLAVLSDNSKKQALLTELCEIYFSFVMTRLRIGEDFKKEGKQAIDSISQFEIYKTPSADLESIATMVDFRKYKKSRLFNEITDALGGRYHYFRLAQKNRLLSYELLDQFRVPLSSCCYKGKRRSVPLQLRMFFKHAEDFIFNEVVPVIISSYEEMKALHPDWIPKSASDDMAKKYYNERTCSGLFHMIKAYWLDTATRGSEYNVPEGAYSVEKRYIKINNYQKKASEEVDEIMNRDLQQMEAGEPIGKQKCVRPNYIMLLDNGLLLWALDKMNAFGLFMDDSGQLLEPDIFDRRYVPEFSEIDPILSRLSNTYDGFYYQLMRNTRAKHFKELHDHTCRIFGNNLEPAKNKHDMGASKLYGGDLTVTTKEYSSSMPQIFDMYLWKYRKDYYCGFRDNTFRYLCLPIDKQGFMNPKHCSIYKPDVASFSIEGEKCS